MVIFCLLVLICTTFVSHTVGAMIILPIVQSVGEAMPGPIHPKLLVFASALMCSGAMGLPISSFPNMNAVSLEDDVGQNYVSSVDFLMVSAPRPGGPGLMGGREGPQEGLPLSLVEQLCSPIRHRLESRAPYSPISSSCPLDICPCSSLDFEKHRVLFLQKHLDRVRVKRHCCCRIASNTSAPCSESISNGMPKAARGPTCMPGSVTTLSGHPSMPVPVLLPPPRSADAWSSKPA